MFHQTLTIKLKGMKLIDALRTENARTENGALTNETSLNNCVDLFFTIGASRNSSKKSKIITFNKAFNENPLMALKILFWVRDVRGGAGERNTFTEIIQSIGNRRPDLIEKNISLIPEYGRWSDVLVLLDTKSDNFALNLIKEGISSRDNLCAKWLPRCSGKNYTKRRWANKIRKFLGLSPKEYRKLLSTSKVVENLMCDNRFDEIEYSKVPSKAMSRYMNSFSRNDEYRFESYLESLKKGESKINSGAVYPYDIIQNLKFGKSDGAELQWNALPNFMEGNDEMILPLVDVSGSMDVAIGGNENLRAMDVAISLGLYISERNIGPFKDSFITFSRRPQMHVLNGGLSDRYSQLKRADWGMNTNFTSVFKLILEKANEFELPQSEMPKKVLVLSDMQFDMADGRYDVTNHKYIKRLYKESGYEMPQIVYWNLNARTGSFPVTINETDCCLISGFSPSILKSVLGGDEMTPMSIMLKTINNERYSKIKI